MKAIAFGLSGKTNMKCYRVIDLQKCNFMDDTYDNPMTLNQLRSRFWSLDDSRTTHYKYFTADYIQEVWQVEFECIKPLKEKV